MHDRVAFARRSQRTASLLVVPAAGLLLLAGCTADTGSGSDDSSSPSSSSSDSTSSSTAESSLEKAGKAALDKVGTGTVISIEQESGGSTCEVLIASDSGEETEVHVAGDGGSITGGPSDKKTEGDDLTENKQELSAAKIDYVKAESIMTGAVDGAVIELNLDSNRGTIVWEGDVVDGANMKHEVAIDAGTGKVIAKN